MMALPAVAVVGGGAVGLSCALHLVRLGCLNVSVIEREHLAAGSSSLSAGIYTTQYITPRDVEFRVKCYELLVELERAGHLDIVRNGFLRLGHNEATLKQLERGAAIQHEFGVSDARVLGPDELADLIPQMRCTDVLGGLFGPSDGYIDGHQLCSAYQRLAEADGARVLQRTALVGARRLPSGNLVLQTSNGEVSCDVVINAAGAWASQVGLLLEAPIDLIPQRHQVCLAVLGEPLGYRMPSVMDYIPGSGDVGLYFRDEGGNQLLAGLHTNDVLEGVCDDPDEYKRSADNEYVEEVAAKLLARLPGLADIGLRPGWAGLYPNSPDGEFIVGSRKDRPEVVMACGVGGLGLYTSPMVGRLAAEWAVYGEPRSFDRGEDFAPDRFP
jgi:glycine/D-amino acid oxidase-like deaminating enzyme